MDIFAPADPVGTFVSVSVDTLMHVQEEACRVVLVSLVLLDLVARKTLKVG